MKYLIIFLFPSLVYGLASKGTKNDLGSRPEGASSAIAATGAGECLSSSHCTYGLMPLQSQGDDQLEKFISENTEAQAQDSGWCAAVAGMMITGAFRAHYPNIVWNSWVDQLDPSMNKDNRHQGVLNFGNDAQTNWVGGGTSPNNINKAMKEITNLATSEDKLMGEEVEPYPVDYYKNILRHKKRAYLMGVSPTIVGEKRTLEPGQNISSDQNTQQLTMENGYYSVNTMIGGHALVLNGYEGDKVIIYDPWGRVYLSSMSLNTYKETKYVIFSEYNLKNRLSYEQDVFKVSGGQNYIKNKEPSDGYELHYIILNKFRMRLK